MSRSPDTFGAPEGRYDDVPPSTRTEEQEIAAGRSAATPFAAVFTVWLVIAVVVTLALGLVVLVLLVR